MVERLIQISEKVAEMFDRFTPQEAPQQTPETPVPEVPKHPVEPKQFTNSRRHPSGGGKPR